MTIIPTHWKWFNEARLGLFIHWGAYAAYGRGEQVLFREHLDQRAYEKNACRWNPQKFDAKAWADVAKRAGMKYAVLTTRHHDGFCLWDSKFTDYTTAVQAPKRDFVREYVEAFRAAGLRVGLYYSLIDWRVPAVFEGPEHDPKGWQAFRDYVHNQVRELLTNYGRIDVMWFDGGWPETSQQWGSHKLVEMMRSLQPHLLINNRLGRDDDDPAGTGGQSRSLGDFSTPEHRIVEDPNRLWESCDVSTSRLWGYATGERWRSADVLLDKLVECASKGGNLLLNVGPTSDGELPTEFVKIADRIGEWMKHLRFGARRGLRVHHARQADSQGQQPLSHRPFLGRGRFAHVGRAGNKSEACGVADDREGTAFQAIYRPSHNRRATGHASNEFVSRDSPGM
jgi:alpha-L-fucosidase